VDAVKKKPLQKYGKLTGYQKQSNTLDKKIVTHIIGAKKTRFMLLL
jgi:hypothetical protein